MDAAVWSILVAAAFAAATVSGMLGMAGGISLLGVMTAVLPAQQTDSVHKPNFQLDDLDISFLLGELLIDAGATSLAGGLQASRNPTNFHSPIAIR